MSLYAQTITQCGWCNGYHFGLCPRVKAIDYYENGTIKHVEFHDGASTAEVVLTLDGKVIGRSP